MLTGKVLNSTGFIKVYYSRGLTAPSLRRNLKQDSERNNVLMPPIRFFGKVLRGRKGDILPAIVR